MIKIKRTVEITYYLDENALRDFAERNGYDEDELNEAIDNDELNVEYLCAFKDETEIDYEVERS